MLPKPTRHSDPAKLVGLKQAAYILGCLQEGMTEEEISIDLESDPQLVKMWVSFMIHNHWVENILDDFEDSKWIVTDKGESWMKKCHIK